MEQAKVIQQASIDTQIMAERLQKIAVGETIPYEDLNELIGRNVRATSAYGNLCSARRQLLKNHGIVFGTIAGFGLRRLNDDEKVELAGSRRLAVNRAAKRALRILASVVPENLSKEKQVQYNVLATHLGALKAITTSQAYDKLEKKVIANSGGKLPLAISLDALK